jgi:hypothetical protein
MIKSAECYAEDFNDRRPLALILESAANSLYHRIPNFSEFVHDMEIRSSNLTDNPRVPIVLVHIRGNVLPQLLEDRCASGEMKRSETLVFDGLSDNLWRRARYGLDDAWGYTGLGEDLVHYVVGVRSGRKASKR